ncbi:hypothetical protein K1719_025825 [Acacia pycnantha]|nr:hypothetical protein K1719_025825 [Acacia pycnantha]
MSKINMGTSAVGRWDWKSVTKETKNKAFSGVLQKKFKLREQHKRRGADGQALSQRNTRSRAQQRVHHTAGTKTFAVTYSEMQKKAQEENTQTNYGSCGHAPIDTVMGRRPLRQQRR